MKKALSHLKLVNAVSFSINTSLGKCDIVILTGNAGLRLDIQNLRQILANMNRLSEN